MRLTQKLLALTLLVGFCLLGRTSLAYAAPPRCFNFDGTREVECDTSPQYGIQDDKCYTEDRGGPSGILKGYAETSCADATDRDQNGQPGGASTSVTCANGEKGVPLGVKVDVNHDGVDDDCIPEGDVNGDGVVDLADNPIIVYLKVIINFLAAGVGIVVAISIVIAGFQYMSSRDNPQAIQAAMQRFWNGVIAMLLFIFMYAILNFLVPGRLIG